MAELAILIIRQHWAKRHDPNVYVRQQARTLIRTHVELLRRWRSES